MASISERKRKDKPSTWQVIVRVKGQKPVARTFDTPEEARRFGEEIEPDFEELRAARRGFAQFHLQHLVARSRDDPADFIRPDWHG